MRQRPLLILVFFCLLGSAAASAQDPAPAGSLPLLPPGQHITIEYGQVMPGEEGTLEDAFFEVITEGAVDTYHLSFYWQALQPTSGDIDLGPLRESLRILEAFQLAPQITFPTIDTVNLVLPQDFMNPNDPAALRDGLRFDDPSVIAAFGDLLDVAVPTIKRRGGFYISVGNEVDGWLSAHPEEVAAFAAFVAAARERVQERHPEVAIGVTMTYSGAVAHPDILAAMQAASDVVAFTYYPLNADFTVQDPAVVADDIARIVALANGGPVLLQEVGYPSGYLPESGNGSSGDLQAQFVDAMFDALAVHPEIRFVSFLQLGEWPGDLCDFFAQYYAIGGETFREYLCTLGLRTYSGKAKPAYDVFLERVAERP